jgi:hypothetical protein
MASHDTAAHLSELLFDDLEHLFRQLPVSMVQLDRIRSRLGLPDAVVLLL